MNWQMMLENEKQKNYYKLLEEFINKEYEQNIIYPAKDKIFNAFFLCPYDTLKVVILGQDPYYKASQAQGLAFSTPKNIKNPPSMTNILKEVYSDIGNSICNHGDLTEWAKQGVFLLNTVLTVEEDKPNSHKDKGWEIFTDTIINHINIEREGIVFLLWGSSAIKKTKLINNEKHLVLTAPHPSPLSAYRGFFGCRHFSKTNEFLKQQGKKEIQW